MTCLNIIRFLIYELLIYIVCISGDNTYGFQLATDSFFLRSMLDSFTHGFIAFVCWAVVTDLTFQRTKMFECCGCTIMAMLLDIDHFLAAGSLKLKLALSLQNRPVFHASSLIPVVVTVILVIAYIRTDSRFVRLAALFTVAWTTHHVRDSIRRGLWFPPFGSTQPVAKATYFGIVMILPVVIRLLFYVFPNVKGINILIDNNSEGGKIIEEDV